MPYAAATRALVTLCNQTSALPITVTQVRTKIRQARVVDPFLDDLYAVVHELTDASALYTEYTTDNEDRFGPDFRSSSREEVELIARIRAASNKLQSLTLEWTAYLLDNQRNYGGHIVDPITATVSDQPLPAPTAPR